MSNNPQEDKKRETEEMNKKQIIKMTDLSTKISLTTISVNDLNIPVKTQIVNVDKKITPSYILFTRNSSNSIT